MTINAIVEPTRSFRGVFIPVEILDLDVLTPTDQILLAWIDSLFCLEKGGCYASNEYLAKKIKVKVNTIKILISKLVDLGLVERVSFDGRTRVIRSRMSFRESWITKSEKKINRSTSGVDLNQPLKSEVDLNQPGGLSKSTPGVDLNQPLSLYKIKEEIKEEINIGASAGKNISSSSNSNERNWELAVSSGYPYKRYNIPDHSCAFPIIWRNEKKLIRYVDFRDPNTGETELDSQEYKDYIERNRDLFPSGIPRKIMPCPIHRCESECNEHCIAPRIMEAENNASKIEELRGRKEKKFSKESNISSIIIELIESDNKKTEIISDEQKQNSKLKSNSKKVKENLNQHGTHVKLTEDSYKKLCDELTKQAVDAIIEDINTYCGMHGKSYANYSLAIKTFYKNRKTSPAALEGERKQRVQENEKNWQECAANVHTIGKKSGVKVVTDIDWIIIGNDKIYYDNKKFKELVTHALLKTGIMK